MMGIILAKMLGMMKIQEWFMDMNGFPKWRFPENIQLPIVSLLLYDNYDLY